MARRERDILERSVRAIGECGTALEARWYCPTCERGVEEGEATDVDYV